MEWLIPLGLIVALAIGYVLGHKNATDYVERRIQEIKDNE